MIPCFCNRLYRMNIPTTITEYAFSGSLCRIRKFDTIDGSRYCLTIFSLYDYKQLHLPHDEYKYILAKLYALQSTSSIVQNSVCNLNENMPSVKQLPFDEALKIKFGKYSMTIGPVTASGLVMTMPFDDIDVFSITKSDNFTCDSKWDICACKMCPAFLRLLDFEAAAAVRKPQNVLLQHNLIES